MGKKIREKVKGGTVRAGKNETPMLQARMT